MHSLRYNPLTKRWMLLGGQLEHSLHITAAHQLEIGKNPHFLAANHPKSPFEMEPAAKPPVANGLLYAPELPVGEYELLLHQGHQEINQWKAAEWEAWIMLLQHRLLQAHRNPYLQHARFIFDSSKQASTLPQRRVGDLIVTRQPLVPDQAIAIELVDMLLERETAFIVAHDHFGTLYVPSAPSYADELWYLPRVLQPDFTAVHGANRTGLAQTLTLIMRMLGTAHLQFDWVIEIHTLLADKDRERSWWLQFYREPHANQLPLAIQRLPETYVQQLRYALAAQTS